MARVHRFTAWLTEAVRPVIFHTASFFLIYHLGDRRAVRDMMIARHGAYFALFLVDIDLSLYNLYQSYQVWSVGLEYRGVDYSFIVINS